MPSKRIRINRDLMLIVVPTLAILVGAFAITVLLMHPAPPNEIVMATGPADIAYHGYALKYREILAREGVTLRLWPTSGALENLRRLDDPQSGVGVAFVQSVLASAERFPNLVSLGGMFYEPFWLFYRGTKEISSLPPLKGKMIAVGEDKSGAAALVMSLLESNGIAHPPTTILKVGGRTAGNLLLTGGIDAAFLKGDTDIPVIRELLRADGVRLMSLRRADAYVRRHSFLTKLTLPEGVIDLTQNVPDREVAMIGATAYLVVRRDLHPALAYVLLRAASEVHSKPNLFSSSNQFPSPVSPELPLSPEAERYYRLGTPFMQRHLPFWAANLLDRLLVLLIPAVAVMLPAARALPALYRWRVRSRIYRWYARLKEIEIELEEQADKDQLEAIYQRLDAIEAAVNRIETPLAYSEDLYVFRQHIDLVRERVVGRLRRSSPFAAPATAHGLGTTTESDSISPAS